MSGPLSQISMFDLPAPDPQPGAGSTSPSVANTEGQEIPAPAAAAPEEAQPESKPTQSAAEVPGFGADEQETDDYPLYPTLPEVEPTMVAEPEPAQADPEPEPIMDQPFMDWVPDEISEPTQPEAEAAISVPPVEPSEPAVVAEQPITEPGEIIPGNSAAVIELTQVTTVAIEEDITPAQEEATPAPTEAVQVAPDTVEPEAPVAIEPEASIVAFTEAPDAPTPEIEQVAADSPEAVSETVTFSEPEQVINDISGEDVPEVVRSNEVATETTGLESTAPSEPEAATTPEPTPEPLAPEPQPVAQPSARPYIAFDIEVVETNEADIPREFLSGRPLTPQGPKVKSTRGRKSIKATEAGPDKILVPEDEELFKKQYYPISEVATMFGVNISQIRYWENEFPQLKPRKNGKGDRLFRPEDVKMLVLIHDLIRRRKYTLEGAKDYLKLNNGEDMRFPLIQQLQKLKGFLNELKANM